MFLPTKNGRSENQKSFLCEKNHYPFSGRSISEVCKCVDEGETKEFNYMHGLWCCNIETCDDSGGVGDNHNVTCSGKAIPLTEKCLSGMNETNQCNSHVWDEYRNSDLERSYLDVCDDR